MILIGVDVGGTFADLVVTNTASGDTKIHKVPNTLVTNVTIIGPRMSAEQ